MAPTVWFITGASSGFGLAVTQHVLAHGDIAIATLRRPTPLPAALSALTTTYPPTRLLVLPLDVAQPASVAAAFAQALATFGRVDVVFNNAGYCVLGEAEGTPEEDARRMFDVNFWGAGRVAREAVRVFREQNDAGLPLGEGNRGRAGRLLTASSIVGWAAAPAMGYYTASKHALEGLMESLSMELDPAWNIKITLVEFGGFATNGVANTVRTPAPAAYSANPALASVQMRAWFASEAAAGAKAKASGAAAGDIRGDPAKAAARVYALAALADPPLRLALGRECVAALRDVVRRVGEGVDEYEAWSEGLELDG